MRDHGRCFDEAWLVVVESEIEGDEKSISDRIYLTSIGMVMTGKGQVEGEVQGSTEGGGATAVLSSVECNSSSRMGSDKFGDGVKTEEQNMEDGGGQEVGDKTEAAGGSAHSATGGGDGGRNDEEGTAEAGEPGGDSQTLKTPSIEPKHLPTTCLTRWLLLPRPPSSIKCED